MTQLNMLVAVCLVYVLFLFAVAFFAERAARRGRGAWVRSAWVYTLSLSIYCTAWTFFGAVGNAARSGFEFLTIYLGPSLVLVGWWWVLRRMVRIGRAHRLTSVADLVSARYGKSNLLATCVTLLAVLAITPYIALQLQSVTLAFEVFASADSALGEGAMRGGSVTAFWLALGLGVFTVVFGTRNLDVNERHHGVVMAIAVEAVVKLAALMAVGIFVVWHLGGGLEATLARIDASPLGTWQIQPDRWVGLTALSAAAFLCLPRMFQVLVVENDDERHLATAGWAFPLYMMLMSLFVMPIAVVGLEIMPEGANPDTFVLTVPLSQGAGGLAVLSFLGGFSAATSMVIVAAIALSTMVSNHLVMPLWLRWAGGGASFSGDVRQVVLVSRRLSIMAILLLGYLYYRVSGGGEALAAIGLVSFAGIAQILPVLLGGLFWRGATRVGALTGLLVGSAVWLWCYFLPSLGAGLVIDAQVMAQGPFQMGWLRPQALFGLEGMDPALHALFWSMSLSTLTFVTVSLCTFPSPLERLQGAQFVAVDRVPGGPRSYTGGTAQVEDLMVMTQRIIGAQEAQQIFHREARRQGLSGALPEPTPDFLEALERELAGSVGTATAHAMVAQIVGGAEVSVSDLLAVADETAQMMEYSARLEAQSQELTRTARELRLANRKLTRLSVQKDAFLSQISHELRTPMTSIRAFSEILRDADGLATAEKVRYASIIHDEAIRLTRLLDDLLDLSVLENGQVNLNLREGWLDTVLDRAVSAALADDAGPVLEVTRDRGAERVALNTDVDRLSQVFINIVSNAAKYCDAPVPQLRVQVHRDADHLHVDFLDNGSGIAAEAQDVIFEKFARVSDQKAGGAGLGLAICRQIMQRLGGEILYLAETPGCAFRVSLPVALIVPDAPGLQSAGNALPA